MKNKKEFIDLSKYRDLSIIELLNNWYIKYW